MQLDDADKIEPADNSGEVKVPGDKTLVPSFCTLKKTSLLAPELAFTYLIEALINSGLPVEVMLIVM
jgi:hypothetical protein